MKRTIITQKDIEICNECYFCKVKYGFSSHVFMCKYYSYVSCEVYSDDTWLEAEKQMSEWFKNCKVWELVK